VLVLSRSDLQSLVPMKDAVELMKIAFRELAAGRATAPLRTVIDVDDAGATLLMPGFVPAERALGFKVVSVFGGNRDKGLPTIHALVCLVDSETGAPVAIMEGGFLTALRTGAVSGAAADLLARPDSKTVTVIGAGVQGVTQAVAICAVRPIERVIAVDMSEDQLKRYKDDMARDWPDIADRVETTTDAASAVAAADIICTATTSRKPVFNAADVRPGTHISAVGAYTPEMQELPAEIVTTATVVVDETAAALAEAGDLIIPLTQGLVDRSHFERELGKVVSGEAPARTSAEEITLFKSVGNAVQDVVVARRAVDLAQEQGVGTQIDLG
jgi:ornithine cyclodeaminase